MPGRNRLFGQSPLGHREQDLDVVRGLAILLAMGSHLNGADTGILALDILRWPGTTFGWAGVDLFFVLSGFLVGRIILREIEHTGEFDRRRFLIRRIFKLWPVLYLFLVAQLIFGDNPWNTYFLQTAFHLQNYLDGSHSHLWSLAVEEHFYLVVALLLPVAVRYRWSSRGLLWGLGVVVVAEPAARIVGRLAGASYHDLQWLTHFRIDGLALGVLLAALHVYHRAFFDRIVGMKVLWAALTVAGVLWLAFVPRQSVPGSTLGYSVTAVTGVAVMLGTYRSRTAAALRRPLAVVAFLGVFSYSIYIWHIAAAGAYERGTALIGLQLPEWGDLGMRYLAAVGLSVIMVRLVEWPSLTLRNRLFPTGASVKPDAASGATTPEPVVIPAGRDPERVHRAGDSGIREPANRTRSRGGRLTAGRPGTVILTRTERRKRGIPPVVGNLAVLDTR